MMRFHFISVILVAAKSKVSVKFKGKLKRVLEESYSYDTFG
jgi:hypothetical protein